MFWCRGRFDARALLSGVAAEIAASRCQHRAGRTEPWYRTDMFTLARPGRFPGQREGRWLDRPYMHARSQGQGVFQVSENGGGLIVRAHVNPWGGSTVTVGVLERCLKPQLVQPLV